MTEEVREAYAFGHNNNRRRVDWVLIYEEDRRKALEFILDEPQGSLIETTALARFL